jgi:putative oxidoreductase
MLAKLFATKAGFGMFWVRLPLAISMILHGYGKITNLSGFVHYCDNLGIPPFFAFMAAGGEFLGGLGVLLGCISRVAAFGVACTMGTAAVVRHLIPGYGYMMNWHGGLPYGTEGYEFHTLCVGMALGIMFLGAGRFSVDYYLAKFLARSSDQVLYRESHPIAAHGD